MTASPATAKYEHGLGPGPANHTPLTPIDFLVRAAGIYPDRTALIHGSQRQSYGKTLTRCRRLAGALAKRGVGAGDTVAIIATNIPPMLEAHFGVPMLGAVLNPINYRLDAATVAFIIDHGEAKVLLVDGVFADLVRAALPLARGKPLVVDIDDPEFGIAERVGSITYEALVAEGDPEFAWRGPASEWQAISLSYTSGTTGDPKGVVGSHRGAFLNALGNLMVFGLLPRCTYLWTLPMFHCNGWTYTWAVTAAAGTHVCLRRVEPGPIFAAIAEHRVTHLCGAPVVLNMLANAKESEKRRFDHTVEVAIGGAAPPAAVIVAMERMGFRVLHLYGLTESYGPATYCAWQSPWDALDLDGRAAMMARQGVRYPTLQGIMVADPGGLQPVPADGVTIGEIMLKGNTVMMGYLKNPQATEAAFRGGWFHTGDLAVTHPDGYIEIKDRAKDIIISGGENISSLEVESVLYTHPAVLEAAVVARPDAHWGETPCAFVAVKESAGAASAEEIVAYCRARLAHFKVPRTVVFGPLPKTSTGKIQKYELRERAKAL